MNKYIVYDRRLTPADQTILSNLAKHIQVFERQANETTLAKTAKPSSQARHIRDTTLYGESNIASDRQSNDNTDLEDLKSLNDPTHSNFLPSVFLTTDTPFAYLPITLSRYILEPYICWAQNIVRRETDVAMLTHLITYFITSVPSALILYWRFTYTHGFLHTAMQLYYIGTYTLMMHQHIHMHGILAAKYSCFDHLFPYLTDPLMGHTWNSYYYHHVKHHHVEGNGPDDLSSTVRYERDNIFHFLSYIARFLFLIWLELPLYFLHHGRPALAVREAGSEFLSYIFLFTMSTLVNANATLFVFLLPLLAVRLGLMAGNWGQHAFVDPDNPNSDYRSSITLIDVASNRFCFNDGYHTSHHLNPTRHWREHPISFLEQKHVYIAEGALVFHNISFMMITIRLLCKDYIHLAKCLVPLGPQINLTLHQRVLLLRRLTRKFSEEEIQQNFRHCTRRSGSTN